MLVANFQEMFCDLSKWENQIPRVNEDNEVCDQRVLHRLFFCTCVFSFSGLASTRYFAVRSWGWNKLRLKELSVPMANNLLRLVVEGNLGQNPKLRLRLRLRPNPNLRRRLRVRVRGRLPERVHPNWKKLKLPTQLVPQTLQLPPSPSGRPSLPLKRCLVSPLRRSLRCGERSPVPLPLYPQQVHSASHGVRGQLLSLVGSSGMLFVKPSNKRSNLCWNRTALLRTMVESSRKCSRRLFFPNPIIKIAWYLNFNQAFSEKTMISPAGKFQVMLRSFPHISFLQDLFYEIFYIAEHFQECSTKTFNQNLFMRPWRFLFSDWDWGFPTKVCVIHHFLSPWGFAICMGLLMQLFSWTDIKSSNPLCRITFGPFAIGNGNPKTSTRATFWLRHTTWPRLMLSNSVTVVFWKREAGSCVITRWQESIKRNHWVFKSFQFFKTLDLHIMDELIQLDFFILLSHPSCHQKLNCKLEMEDLLVKFNEVAW